MHKKGSTLYPEAKKKAMELFEQGVKPAEAYRTLTKKLRNGLPPLDVRYVYRWQEEWRTNGQLANAVGVMASDEPVPASDAQEAVEEYVPARKAGLDLVPAPSLDELINGGVPRDYAPRLLVDWDIAYDNGENYRTQLFNKAVDVCRECGDIPWDRALSLASLDLSYEKRHDESAGKLSALIRRYRPWEGTENLLAFRRRAEYLKLKVPTERSESEKEQLPPPSIKAWPLNSDFGLVI